MMQVKIIEACLVRGEHQAVGKVLTVPDLFAQYLVRIKRATVLAPLPETAKDPGPQLAETAVRVPARPKRG